MTGPLGQLRPSSSGHRRRENRLLMAAGERTSLSTSTLEQEAGVCRVWSRDI